MGLEAYSQTLWLGLQKLGGDTWGGLEFWGEGVASETRWREVLNSGCREGVEIRRIWGRLVQGVSGVVGQQGWPG